MKLSKIAPLAFVAILSVMVTISSAAPAVEADNNTAVESDDDSAVEADNNSGSKRRCRLGCTKEYNPWCAKLGNGEYRTFGNPCMYRAYKCTHPREEVKLISKTACPIPPPICPIACTDQYDPVCAKLENGEYRTFGNLCEYEVYKCGHPKERTKFISKTACPEVPNPTPTCPKACTKEYNPVCAKLGNGKYQTFGNHCTFEVYMCEHPKEMIELISKTACPEEPPTIACDIACIGEQDTVCVKLGSGKYQTFESECNYALYVCEHPKENTEIVSRTACPKEPTPAPTCDMACMDIWDPVCATFKDGRTETFGNDCELRNAMCGRPKEKVDVTKGECPK